MEKSDENEFVFPYIVIAKGDDNASDKEEGKKFLQHFFVFGDSEGQAIDAVKKAMETDLSEFIDIIPAQFIVKRAYEADQKAYETEITPFLKECVFVI